MINDTSYLGRFTHTVVGAMACLAVSVADAFEFATHAAISRQAFAVSTLFAGALPNPASTEVLVQLGLENCWADLGFVYLDIGSGDIVERAAQPLGDSQLGPRKIDAANKGSSYAPQLPSVPAWIMLGSIREDDVPFSEDELENTPQDEVGGPFIRVKNHFYDPFNDRPLTFGGLVIGAAAKDWALRDQRVYTIATTTSTSRWRS